MPKRVTNKRLPQTGRGKSKLKKCPQCGECYLINLWKKTTDRETRKTKLFKKALYCECCNYIEFIEE